MRTSNRRLLAKVWEAHCWTTFFRATVPRRDPESGTEPLAIGFERVRIDLPRRALSRARARLASLGAAASGPGLGLGRALRGGAGRCTRRGARLDRRSVLRGIPERDRSDGCGWGDGGGCRDGGERCPVPRERAAGGLGRREHEDRR